MSSDVSMEAVASSPTRIPPDVILQGLQQQFLDELLTERYLVDNEPDERAAPILGPLLDQFVRVEEKSVGPRRKFGPQEIAMSRARKAAELLSMVPDCRLRNGRVQDFAVTRRIIWETLITGLMAAESRHDEMIAPVARALLEHRTLSDNERNTLKDVLRARFDATNVGIQPFLLRIIRAVTPTDEELVIQAALLVLVKTTKGQALVRLCKAIGEKFGNYLI